MTSSDKFTVMDSLSESESVKTQIMYHPHRLPIAVQMKMHKPGFDEYKMITEPVADEKLRIRTELCSPRYPRYVFRVGYRTETAKPDDKHVMARMVFDGAWKWAMAKLEPEYKETPFNADIKRHFDLKNEGPVFSREIPMPYDWMLFYVLPINEEIEIETELVTNLVSYKGRVEVAIAYTTAHAIRE